MMNKRYLVVAYFEVEAADEQAARKIVDRVIHTSNDLALKSVRDRAVGDAELVR